jgi:photosystem II stability/assembly factor-like uncharacterized protein
MKLRVWPLWIAVLTVGWAFLPLATAGSWQETESNPPVQTATDPPEVDTQAAGVATQDEKPQSDQQPAGAENSSATSLASDDIDWLKHFSWRSVGPTATGGRIVDIAVHPQNEHHILAASAAGGLWETKNNGTTWSLIFSNEGSISLGDVAFDPQQPETIWVGTGEANNQRSSLQGDGVYKSTDGGKTWQHKGLKDSFHIGRIVVDPTNSDVVYVAAAGHLYTENEERGLFKTTDGGNTWNKVLYINPRVGVIDVIVHPTNPQIVLAASYERLRRPWNLDEAGPGSAIHRSADGGQTWTRLQGGLPDGQIGRIGLAYFAADPNVMYATVANLNLRPAGSGGPSEAGRNRSRAGASRRGNPQREERDAEDDAADQEQQTDEADAQPPADANLDDRLPTRFGFELVRTDEHWVVAEMEAGSLGSQAGIRNGDRLNSVGGTSDWDADGLKSYLAGIQPGDRIQWVFQRAEQEVPITLNIPRSTRAAEIGGEIYRSDDAGLTWTKTNRQPVGGNPPYYYGQIAIDPQNADRLYVLSVPLYVSDDGGKTFNQGGARSVHVDHHALWINPRNPNHVILGNDGGFHISYDRCETWDYVFNIPLAQFYAITADQQRPYHIYGGLQDNGSWGGPSDGAGGVSRDQWYRVGGGDGFYVQVDPTDHNIVYAESQFGAIFRLNRATGERKSIRPPQSEPRSGARDRYNWNSPILLSRHHPHTLYFGGNKLFMSYNQGDEWLVISPDLTTADPAKLTGNVPHCTITTIAESPLDPDWLMVGTDDGKVHLTRDRGKNWEDVSTGFPTQPESWWCSRVEFSHADKATAYVSFTGYREDDFRPFLFKTTDGGRTWHSISSNLPNQCVNVVKQDPRRARTLYVGTDLGCYVSLDDGASWKPLPGFGKLPVVDLLVHPRERDLIIGTHGRGILIMDDVTPFQETTEAIHQQAGHLFTIRDWEQVRLPEGSGFAGDRKVVAPNSPSGAVIWYQINPSAKEQSVELLIEDLDGNEIAKLPATNEVGWHRTSFPTAGGGGRGGRGGRPSGGPRAIQPGIYRAVLLIGDEAWEQIFQIRREN